MITENDAIALIACGREAGIELFLDGGWGVDALLGRQTRAHDDIDLFVERQAGVCYADLLRQRGFEQVARPYTTDSHMVWEDAEGRVVDLHLFDYAADGAIRFENAIYPAGVFGATGRIGTQTVRCIPPAEQVEFHRGYDFDENDVHDVRMLCAHFGIPEPEEYRIR